MNKAVILITGGTGKIGINLVRFFAKQAVQVVFTGRSPEKVKKLVSETNAANNVMGFPIDHQDPNSAESLLKELKKLQVLPTHIINNVRDVVNLKLDGSGRPSYEAWSQEFYLGVILPYELAMMALQYDAPLKKIVNISSMYGLVAANPHLYDNPIADSPIHYGVVKAAQNHLTKEMAVRLAGQGVSVNAVAYGGIEGRVNEDFKKRYAKLCPLGRMLNEGEVPGIIKYLLLDADAALTGQTIAVDGGWSIW